MFIAAIYPVTSRLYLSSKDSLREVVERSFKYLLIAGLTLVILITLLSDYIIFYIFGREYLPSVECLKILIWAELFVFLNIAYGNLLKSINRQELITYVVLFVLSLNVVLNLILIPRFSYIGASYATLMARASSFLLFSTIIMKSEYRFSSSLINNCLKISSFLAAIWVFSFIVNLENYMFALIYLVTAPFALIYSNVIDEVDKKIAREIIFSIKSKLSRI